MRIFIIALAALIAFATACSSVRVFEMPKVQSEMERSLRKTEDIIQKAATDLREKKALIDNLGKSATPAFKGIESDLKSQLANMQSEYDSITQHRKRMIQAKSDIASLSYSRAKINSAEREYPLVESAVESFEQATTHINTSLASYSRESNSLADLIAQKKLFFNFDVAEFQTRIKKSIKVSQDNLELMQKEVTRAEHVINNWQKPEGRATQEEIFNEIVEIAGKYSDRAQRFSELSSEVHSETAGIGKISTLDPAWPEVQKLVNEFDAVTAELTSTFEEFKRKVESFRNPLKRIR